MSESSRGAQYCEHRGSEVSLHDALREKWDKEDAYGKQNTRRRQQDFRRGSGKHATEAELQDWVRARLAAFKVPVAVRFVPDTLPRNANGKILKRELKALFEEEAA